MRLMSQLKYVRLFLDNAAILSGKKIARFYTISETQAARNLYHLPHYTFLPLKMAAASVLPLTLNFAP